MRYHLLFFVGYFLIISCTNSSTHQTTEEFVALPDGGLLFIENCAACHGRDGTLRKAGSKDLTEITLDFNEIKHVIEWGTENGMPRFKEILKTTENIDAVSSYVLGLQRTNDK